LTEFFLQPMCLIQTQSEERKGVLMIVNHLENGVTEYVTEKAIVRIHPGKLTEEQRKAVLEDAARNFYRAVQKTNQNKAV